MYHITILSIVVAISQRNFHESTKLLYTGNAVATSEWLMMHQCLIGGINFFSDSSILEM